MTTANQNVPNNVTTTLTMGSVAWDTADMVDLGTFPTRITCVQDGFYIAQAQISWAFNAAGFRELRFLITRAAGGTSTPIDSRLPGGDATNNSYQRASSLMDLAPGDFVELQGKQTSGGALNANQVASTFGIVRVSPRT